MTRDCIFCKIANKEIPKDFVYEDEKIMAFEDINPKAPVHLLIIPKKHIPSVDHLGVEDKTLMGEIILTAKKIAKEKDLKGYKLIINVGRSAGQLIDHLHLHLLAGRPMRMP
ncbi:histidine triad nucleotide-binding protein [Patescibacteria group bacterium]|nr:histidine triad nucleotide-binding protein [Patescibacteria group bacterium]